MPPTFTRDIQPALLWDTQNPPPGLPLRDYHPLRCGIPADFRLTIRRYQGPNTTSLLPFGKRFGLPYAVFGRPYSRHRCCFLFLRVLRCFNSPRSQSQWDRYGFTVAGSPIRESPDQRLLAPTRGISQLGTPFFGARAKPSTRRCSSSSFTPRLRMHNLIGA